MSRLTPFSTSTCMTRNLRDQALELAAHLVCGPSLDVRAVVAEEDEVDRLTGSLLVAQERLPGALAVDADGLRLELPLDLVRAKPGDPERGEQPERHRLSMRQVG